MIMSWGPIFSNVGRSLGPHLGEWVDALKFDKARPPSAYNTIAEYVIWISNSCRHTNSWDHKVASTQMKSQSALWLWPDWYNKGQLMFHVCKGKIYIYIKWNNKNKMKRKLKHSKTEWWWNWNIATKLTYVQSYSKSYRWVVYIDMHQ